MAQWHLDNLRKNLTKNKIIVENETIGNNYDISAFWELSLKGSSMRVRLVFEGLGDDAVLPIEKSYGVKLELNKDIGIYIPKGKPVKDGAKKQWSESVNYLINSILNNNQRGRLLANRCQ